MAKLLWQPTEAQIKRSNMVAFMQFVNDRQGTRFASYDDLYQWSVTCIPDFWAALWDFIDVKASRTYDRVVDGLDKMPGARWFPGARLNFAENLLRYRDDRPALIFYGENRVRRNLSYAKLYDEVARTAYSLKKMGVEPGDRVAGFIPNMPEAVIAMLAAVSLGAVWSSCSPDFGFKGVLDRFGQIRPKVLFTADGYFFKGKKFDSPGRIKEIVNALSSLEKVVVAPYIDDNPTVKGMPDAVLFDDFKSDKSGLEIAFAQRSFSHPVYIMYSSGTTGLPKCMVQSAGGILLHQQKELVLHTDMTRDDVLFYVTTCGWMMWNWLVSGLGTGAALVLYDGNPFHPDPGALWRMAENEKLTVFGTSAGYIAALRQSGIKPGEKYDLASLRAVLSTGSPLSADSFEFIYDAVKKDVQLASIAGGSDLNGCFALGCPMLPVHAGEIQCRGLGMKVFAFDENGEPVIGREGELVCTAPFPSMPIHFWDDADGKKYHNAYFDVYPNVWRHGDFIEVTGRGGVIMLGRSDATLNPGGVRIGTAEIYRLTEQIDGVSDSLVIGQKWKNDVRMVLFVKMADGVVPDDAFKQHIREILRTNASPRHVPAEIIAVPDIPYTLNMKKVELAVKNIIEGKPVLNRDALVNPEALDFYADLSELTEN